MIFFKFYLGAFEILQIREKSQISILEVISRLVLYVLIGTVKL